MLLTIVTPTNTRSLVVNWIEVNTANGNRIIQNNHVPLFLTLLPHKPFIFCHENNQEETIMPISGILDFYNNNATVLLYAG